MNDKSDQPVILVQNPILPPYRVAFVRKLTGSSTGVFVLVYGKAQIGAALQSVEKPAGVDVIPLRNVFVGRGPLLTLQFGLLRVVRWKRWDAMIATFDPRLVFNLLAMPLMHVRGGAFIWWGHGIRPKGRFTGLYRYLANRADAVILYSGDGKRRLAELGVPAEKLFVAWNSIDTDEISTLASSEWKGRSTILCIGRLIREKRVDLLIQAFGLASNKFDSTIRLAIVGEGPELDALKSLAKELNLTDGIDWVGAQYEQRELATHFNRALICVSAGYVGLSAIHALAFGVPMLYGDNEPHSPEIEALRLGINSESFTAGDADALAASLSQLLDDRPKLEAMGRAGQKHVLEQFSVAKMVNTFEEAIAYAVASRKRK